MRCDTIRRIKKENVPSVPDFCPHQDHLGSTRLVTLSDQSVYENMDFLPFGEQIEGGSGVTHKFTGQERDGESNLDNFVNRYDSSQLGRFMTPDPLGIGSADLTNPESLNQYSYVINNPMNLIDPTGLDVDDPGDPGDPGGDPGDPGGWGEDPGIPIAQGPAHTSSHTPFPVPGQGIDWLNWLLGPPCLNWQSCANSWHTNNSGYDVGDSNGEQLCGAFATCVYWDESSGTWDSTEPPPTDRQMLGTLKSAGDEANRGVVGGTEIIAAIATVISSPVWGPAAVTWALTHPQDLLDCAEGVLSPFPGGPGLAGNLCSLGSNGIQEIRDKMQQDQ